MSTPATPAPGGDELTSWKLWHTEAEQPVIYAGERVIAYTETDEQASALLALAGEMLAARPVVAAAREINDWFLTHGLNTGLTADHPAHRRLGRAEVALLDALEGYAALAARDGEGEG